MTLNWACHIFSLQSSCKDTEVFPMMKRQKYFPNANAHHRVRQRRLSSQEAAALAKDPVSVPRTHEAAHNCLYFQFQGMQCLHLAYMGTCMVVGHITSPFSFICTLCMTHWSSCGGKKRSEAEMRTSQRMGHMTETKLRGLACQLYWPVTNNSLDHRGFLQYCTTTVQASRPDNTGYWTQMIQHRC